MKYIHHIPKSIVDGIVWPALPSTDAAKFLALMYQINELHYQSTERIHNTQFRQLTTLISYTYQHVPSYRQQLSALGYKAGQIITPDFWQKLPILKRTDIQDNGGSLTSSNLPRSHGEIHTQNTSGSSGHPIETKGTSITSFFWDVNTVHEHLIHNRNLEGKHAFIRAEGTRRIPREGLRSKDWGTPASLIYNTGPATLLDIQTSIEKQAKWLIKENPDYLLTHPTNIAAIADYFIDKNKTLPNLKHIRTFGEKLDLSVREKCKSAWGVNIIDAYSSQEVGQMAFQCPEHDHYHVISNSVYLEVINDDGQHCLPGEIGRVVVTTLHNFAMPLIRYEILDYAEVGEPCSCGRGLPVLKQVIGRQRNMITMPNGDKHWPRFPAKMWAEIAPIVQIQLVQHDLKMIEAKIVTKRKLTETEENNCKSVITERFGYPFEIKLTYLDEILRTKNAKYEDFVSMVK